MKNKNQDTSRSGKKKLQHVFHPGASLILADLVAAMARFEDLVSVPRRWPFSSAKKAAGSSGHRSLQILQGVPEIMALTKKSLKSCRQGVAGMKFLKVASKLHQVASLRSRPVFTKVLFSMLQDLEVS